MQAAEKIKKPSKKSGQIEVKIQEIKEQEFFCKEISEELQPNIEDNKVQIGFGVKFDTDPEQETLSIGFKTAYNCDLNGEKCRLLTYEIKVTFKIGNFNKVVFPTESNTPRIDENFLISMLGVVIGTARGMILIKTTGHFINKFYLPIINPQALFRSLVKSKQGDKSK